MVRILKPLMSYNIRIYLFILFLLQIAFVDAYLPVGEWFTNGAIYSDDFSFHYADALSKSRYFKEYNMLYGYTPYMRAPT